MSEVAYRKIDIDAFDEDVIHESELYEADPRDPSQVLADAKQKAAGVRTALAKSAALRRDLTATDCYRNRSDIPGAMQIALENAPYGLNVDEAKVIVP